ncbi:MAG: hypothetical protein WCK13_13335 [Ignavibacteriota bacterium]|nr:hypothetical protein [Ignavibacteriota bacterium]
MKNLILLLSILFLTSFLSAQVKIDNDTYKFRVEFTKGWKTVSKVETDKKDVINYSLSRNDKFTAAIIAFKFPAVRNIDDFVYTLEKDFNLNIPEKTNSFNAITGDVYVGKSADYKDNDNIEKIYYFTTTKDSSGDYFCFMLRFIADVKYKKTDFDSEVTNIVNTFKVIL